MTQSRREQALSALTSVLSSISAEANRAEALTQALPAEGLVAVRSGTMNLLGTTLSPPSYEYEHVAELDILVPRKEGDDAGEAEAALDALMVEINEAIAADRSLGGVVNHAEARPPQTSNLAIEGAPEMRGAVVPIALWYITDSPLT